MAIAAAALAQAPAGTVEPIHRVANDEPSAADPAAAADQPTAKVASRVLPEMPPFNLAPIPGAHPLEPALRVAKEGLAFIDANIRDYQAILYKQERIDGELQEQEVAYIKVRHDPFSVHLFFLKPHRGRECLYVEGANEGKLLAREGSGLKRRVGVVKLDPDGHFAMAGQKYPITKIGVRKLTSELIDVATNDVNFGECEVLTSQTEIGAQGGEKRPVTLITVIHPTPRRSFRFHKAEVFIDNELRVPIRYAAYMWPASPEEQPPLEEAYTYVNMQVNNGFTDADFDPENPELFKD
jgi:hypothetical protein